MEQPKQQTQSSPLKTPVTRIPSSKISAPEAGIDPVKEQVNSDSDITKTEEVKPRSFLSRLNITIGGRVKLEDKMIFTRNLAVMIKAGLPLSRALGILERQSKKPKMKEVLHALVGHIARGNALHEALAVFPSIFHPLFVSMVKAGEESGKLPDALGTIGKHLEESYELRKKVQGALIYPAIIMSAIIIVGGIMLIYVVPVLSSTFKELGVDLPLSTRAVIAVSDFLRGSASLALAVFATTLLIIVLAARTRSGRRLVHATILHLPIISPIVKEVNTARTARTLSSLLSAGIHVTESLEITRGVVQNIYYNEVLKEAREKVEKGIALSKVFTAHEKVYPLLMGEMIAVGEETGKLADMLLEVAEFYEGEVGRKTRDMSAVIEPFLMIVIGVAVGFFALSMITPMYSLVGSI